MGAWGSIERIASRSSNEILSPEQRIDLAAWDDRSWVAHDRMKYALARLKHDLGWTEPNGPIKTIRGVGYRYRAPSE